MRLSVIVPAGRPEPSGARPPGAAFRVALVYPPYGPSGLPSLGLALLSAGVKRLGIPCRTFYWNLDFMGEMPGDRLADRLALYFYLTGRNWMPFNEWVFARLVHGEALVDREADVCRRLDEASAVARRYGQGLSQVKAQILSLRERAPDLVARIVDQLEPYALIGINTTFYQNLPALALARAIKHRWPHKIVVLGGANCDGEMGEALLRHFSFVDHVFSGEVDHAFPEFALRLSRAEPVAGIPGMLQRGDDGRVSPGPPADPVSDLDALPLPDFDDYISERERLGLDRIQEVVLALESSRGCWWGARHHCTFCGLNANGMGYRHKDAERFQSEVETIVNRYRASFIFMTDNILSMNYYEGFMDWASKAGLRTNFFYEIKANVERRHVARLADAGITAVQPGIESLSSKILSLMRKGTTGIKNIALLKFAREYGVYVAYNILVGFPGEDGSEYARVAREVPKLVHLRPPSGMPEVEFHRFSPYHQAPEQFGIRLRPSAMYRDLYPLPEDELARVAYLFEEVADRPKDCSYADELATQVARWRRAFREDDCTLTWRADGGDVVVHDRRDETSPCVYRLRGFAERLFHLTDSPAALAGLIREAADGDRTEDSHQFLATLFEWDEPSPGETIIQFTRDEFLIGPDACLKPLVDAGLFYSEDGRYLALPVAETYRPMTARWLETGV